MRTLLFGVVAFVLVLAGCSDNSSSVCGKDTDCKGERICEMGVCVNPEWNVPDASPDARPDAMADARPDAMADAMPDAAAVPSVMVAVPAGNFQMGCNAAVDNECYSDESPYHEVYLNAYSIDKYEVTAGEYKTCVDAGTCAYNGGTDSFHTYNNGMDDHPINYVNWSEAKTYCEWQGKRLPTEAEWEKASRGTDGRKYPWGNESATCSYAVMAGCPGNTQLVGSMPAGASPYGALDMSGNVWEWTNDWYGGVYYSGSPSSNPQGPASGTSRVVRGGSFYNNAFNLRSSNRVSLNPSYRRGSYGFRCAQ